MDGLDVVGGLGRGPHKERLLSFLSDFETHKALATTARCVYVSGPAGAGKTRFVLDTLSEVGYDILDYDTCRVRNKAVVEALASTTTGATSVMSLLGGKPKPLAVVMDDIDGMNTGDKGGINALIKLVRRKKTARQRSEATTAMPVVCIGGVYADKKLTELHSAAGLNIELELPTDQQVVALLRAAAPTLAPKDQQRAARYCRGNLHRVSDVIKLLQAITIKRWRSCLEHLAPASGGDETAKDVTAALLAIPPAFADHGQLIGETERTSVGLLVHENTVDVLHAGDSGLYLECLDRICAADRIDRAAFQKQIWGFNEMSSLVKTMGVAHVLHQAGRAPAILPDGVRFTKVLTKYATEYNNSVFVRGMCEATGLDRKDLCAHMIELRERHSDACSAAAELDDYGIGRVEVERVWRLLGVR
jgi:hypothetical protein